LQKLDDEVDDAGRRVDEARQRLAEAEGRLHSAPEADAKSLAAWIEGRERGERQAPVLYERQRDVEAARRLVRAATIALDQALERRLRWVDENRRKLVDDANAALAPLREKYVATVGELVRIRDQMLDPRATLEWTATFLSRFRATASCRPRSASACVNPSRPRLRRRR
jgi:hypothetical protein